jgi:hypothetical protein
VRQLAGEVGTERRRARPPALAVPTSTSSDNLGHSNKHPPTRCRHTAASHCVAPSCPFRRVANIDPPASHAIWLIAPCSHRTRPPVHSNHQRDCGAPASAAAFLWPSDTTHRPTATIRTLQTTTGATDTRYDTLTTRAAITT